MNYFCAALFAIASCGSPRTTNMDASASGGDAVADANVSQTDGAFLDAPIDAVPGTLFADPPDPASTTLCSGVLGFPAVPVATVWNQTQNLTLVDVSGDGVRDLVYSTGDHIAVQPGLGNGTFEWPTYHYTPSNTQAFRVADVNGDGAGDLVYASIVESSVRIRLNIGNGWFGAEQTYGTGAAVRMVVVGDINADGKQDLVVLHDADRRVAVLVNTGASFAAPAMYTTGESDGTPLSLAVGDMTGDGRPEVVVTTAFKKVNVLRNTTGGFALPVSYTSSLSVGAVAIADMNKDGNADAIVGAGDGVTSFVSVRLNQGGGVLGAATDFSASAHGGYAASSLAVADIDADGNLDIALAGTLSEYVGILRGTGTGSFGAPTDLFGYARDVALSDVNGDSRPDLFMAGLSSVNVYLNTGTAQMFELRVRSPLADVHRVRMEDVDGDTRQDVVAFSDDGSGTPPRVVTARIDVSGGLTMLGSTTVSTAAHVMHLADFNNDNRRDVLLVGSQGGEVLLNTGTGAMATTVPFAVPGAAYVGVGDANNDGLRDLFVLARVGTSDGAVFLLRGLGNGAFAAPVQRWIGSAPHGLAIADFDADNNIDMAIEDASPTATLHVVRGNGNGTFAAPQSYVIGTHPSDLAARDVDADGDLDLVRHHNQHQLSVMLGIGAAAFTGPFPSHVTAFGRDVAFGDVNGDGKLDIVTTLGQLMSLALGEGNGTFGQSRIYDGAGDGHGGVAMHDVNNDGRLDVLVVGDHHISVLFGRCL